MTFPSAGGRNFLGQGHFSKFDNSCLILFKFSPHMWSLQANVPVKYLRNGSKTVDTTAVSMATIFLMGNQIREVLREIALSIIIEEMF